MKSEKPGSPGRADGTNLAADTYLANSSLVGQIAFKQSGTTRMTTTKQYVYLRVAQYTNNTLNQITSRDIPATVDVMGDALATNTVTVNGQTPYRKNEYFRQQLTVTNSSAPVWQSITVSSPGQTSIIGNAYIAKEPETFSYDADGNLTQDGRWAYTWDGENRLISQISLSSAPTTSKFQISYAYDYQGRRIQKVVSTNNGSAYVSDYTRLFIYDAWNMVGEMTSTTSLLRGYFWGSDLSGSLQGVGGVGGLLEVSYRGATTTNGFMAYDVNGNVAAVVNAADGAALANYVYGPFGEVIRATGPMAKLNPFRFSTKYDDDETDFLYYGFRYYNPSTGRWLSRDPSGEDEGGPNLYGFVDNDAVDNVDEVGMMTLSDVDNAYSQFQAQVSGKPCSCCGNVQWSLNLLGAASGTTVRLTAITTQNACVLSVNNYYWWNCVNAQKEFLASGGTMRQIAFGNQSWHNYGFYSKGNTDTETHTGHSGWWAQMTDANHWDFYVIVFYVGCSNGKTYAGKDQSNDVQFNWNQVNLHNGSTTGYWSAMP